jgi:hypothetical protein
MEALIHYNQLSVVYGRKTIDFSLLYCDRKTMEIAVLPDSTVIVKAPVQSDIALIEKKIRKQARWILRQLNYFKQFNPKTPDRCYVNGETHLYLGKQYRLKLVEGPENSVKIISRLFSYHLPERTDSNCCRETFKAMVFGKGTASICGKHGSLLAEIQGSGYWPAYPLCECKKDGAAFQTRAQLPLILT